MLFCPDKEGWVTHKGDGPLSVLAARYLSLSVRCPHTHRKRKPSSTHLM